MRPCSMRHTCNHEIVDGSSVLRFTPIVVMRDHTSFSDTVCASIRTSANATDSRYWSMSSLACARVRTTVP